MIQTEVYFEIHIVHTYCGKPTRQKCNKIKEIEFPRLFKLNFHMQYAFQEGRTGIWYSSLHCISSRPKLRKENFEAPDDENEPNIQNGKKDRRVPAGCHALF